VVLEYSATHQNQPSWFHDHYECGVDFGQLAGYASRLGLACEVVPIDNILHLSSDHLFLTMDVFTSQDQVAREHPGAVGLWQGNKPLSVLAYTKDDLRAALMSERVGLKEDQVGVVMRALHDSFYSIHDQRFDTKNPTTWSYSALLLRKSAVADWSAIGEPLAVTVIAEALGLPESAARGEWRMATADARMGPLLGAGDINPLAVVLSGIIYDVVKRFGATVWVYMLEPRLDAWLAKNSVDAHTKRRLHRALARAVQTFCKPLPRGGKQSHA
jgi:hypothetical protein